MHDHCDNRNTTGLEIAIVGMEGRFPGADDVEAFWRNIRDGVESVTVFSDDQLQERGVSAELLSDPDYVKAGVVFEGIDQFDAEFFGYTPRDAEHLDPQQRIFLECAWAALEHAGYDPSHCGGTVGVYAGSGANLYLIRHVLPRYDLENGGNIADLLGLMSGNLADALCTRVAYKLDLRGPAVTVQTACSTSLMAVHTAYQALLNHECDMALAGGVSLNLLQKGGYRYQPGVIFSPDGHCRAFDAKAAGTLQGSGAGIVVLKRLEDALKDRDTIHAVIKGSAANNDGSEKVGFTAPSISGQAAVIQAAQALADISAETIGYVEAHGTGTTLGDPIEIAALTEAFRASTDNKGFCAIGSVKTNVGHLDAAAGITGLIKAVLSLKNRALPPSLNFDKPNPQIDFAGSPFYVNTKAKPWPARETPRRAGVSSFGIGGTNVHVILEEAPLAVDTVQPPEELQFLMLSGRTQTALDSAIQNLSSYLEHHPEQRLHDVAYTLQMGRKCFDHRAVALASNRAVAMHALSQHDPALFFRGEVLSEHPSVAFLFPGQGAQHVEMGLALYEHEDAFRQTVDHCCERLQPLLGLDLRELLFPLATDKDEAAARLAQTAITQPALFVVEYALAQWWIQQGIRPEAMLGHSIGEYVAACLAGVFTLEDALTVVAERGRLLQTTEPGAMLAVTLPKAELQSHLRHDCELAAVNAADLCVLSGTIDAIDGIEQDLARQGVAVKRLHVSHAFHSALVEPMLGEFEALLSRITLSAPRIPFISNLTGRWITTEEAVGPSYWVRHLRGTVRFADGLGDLLAKPDRVLLEVGPGETLSALARRHPQTASRPVLASQCHPQRIIHNTEQPVRCLVQLWVAGIDVEDALFRGAQGQRIPLPTYPFERQSYWIDAPMEASSKVLNTSGPRDLEDWFYTPSWKRTAAVIPRTDATDGSDGILLVLSDASNFGDGLCKHLQCLERPLVRVQTGERFARLDERRYAVRPGEREDFEQLLREVESEVGAPSHILHTWSLDSEDTPRAADEILERSFYSLLALAQALDGTNAISGEGRVAITVVANQLEDVIGTEPLCPEKATLYGPCKVIPQEYPHISCRVIDVLPSAEEAVEERFARQIVAEIKAAGEVPAVAYRGPHRWVRTFDPARRETPTISRLRKHGVYLITGGLGGIGLTLARYLAQEWQARLVLLGRSISPDKISAVAELEALSAEVLALQTDVADAAQVRAAVDEARRRFGVLHGVVHAAGVAGGGMIAQRGRASIEKVFAPKLLGTSNLLAALDADGLDFMLLCSSLTAITGGFGQVDYCAANCFLDALATRISRRSNPPVLSVNWDTWQDVGMAAHQNLPDGVGIAPPQAGVLLERLLSQPHSPQTLISTLGIEQQCAAVQSTEHAERLLPEPPTKQQMHSRPTLQSSYVEPGGELEQGLARLWSDFLGIEPIGIEDNLLELGGDSLLVIRLLAKVRSIFGVELHPTTFFKNPTIASLALLIEEHLIEEIENAEPATDRVSETI